MRQDLRLNSFDVFRVDAVEPFIRAAGQLILLVAKHRLPTGTEMHLVGFKIPLPQSLTGASKQHRAALFACRERLERFLAFGLGLLEFNALAAELEDDHHSADQRTECALLRRG